MNDAARPPATPPERTALLRARARALARRGESAATHEQTWEVVAFHLGAEGYAVEAACVREVAPLQDLTAVPCTPPFVCGIINLRSQILTVLNLKRLFDLPEQGLVDRHHVIVLHSGPMEVGILVDGTPVVRALRPGQVQPALPTLPAAMTAWVRGVTADGLVILDLARLLAEPRIVVQEEVAT